MGDKNNIKNLVEIARKVCECKNYFLLQLVRLVWWVGWIMNKVDISPIYDYIAQPG